MKALGRYATAAFLVVLVATLALWPFLDGPGHQSLLTAGAIAWPVQVVAFGLLNRAKSDPSRFFLVWGMGTLVRMGIIAVAGLGLSRLEGIEPAVLLMSIAGFFFVLLLLEPAFFNQPRESARFAR